MGSASQPMLVVKANRALLKKRRGFKEIRKRFEGYTQHTELSFKELTPFEKKRIKDQIRQEAKKAQLEHLKMIALSFVLVLLALSLVVFLWS